jgi:hypothetical protein
MSEARKFTVDDVAAGELPERLRGAFGPDDLVRVTVEEKPVVSDEPRYKKFLGIAASRNTSIDEAVARVRSLRDEWD